MTRYSKQHYRKNITVAKDYYELFFERGHRILDIGCSFGDFLMSDTENIVGIDIDADQLKIARGA